MKVAQYVAAKKNKLKLCKLYKIKIKIFNCLYILICFKRNGSAPLIDNICAFVVLFEMNSIIYLFNSVHIGM